MDELTLQDSNGNERLKANGEKVTRVQDGKVIDEEQEENINTEVKDDNSKKADDRDELSNPEDTQ